MGVTRKRDAGKPFPFPGVHSQFVAFGDLLLSHPPMLSMVRMVLPHVPTLLGSWSRELI